MRHLVKQSGSAELELARKARLQTLDQLLQWVVPLFLNPPPSRDTLRAWFDRAGIRRFKSNPLATRGGGPVYYDVSGVETFLRSRTIPKRITARK